MDALIGLFLRFWALFVWWYVVQPWERALRVRAGSRTMEVGPGLHFRVPYLDVVYRQEVRLHFSSLSPQTVTTTDGKTITFAGIIGYEIGDVLKLYQTMQNPDLTVQSLAIGALAQHIATHADAECEPDLVEQAVVNDLDLEQYGLKNPRLSLTTYARVRTYRLIVDEHALYSTGAGVHNGERAATMAASVSIE
jgi:hypothetical protein